MSKPRHILHIGNGNGKHHGKRCYDVGRKLQQGLIRAGHNVLFFSDRDVSRASGLAGTRLYGTKRTNQQLLRVARHFQPDILLLGHADIIHNNTLEEIRQYLPDIRCAQYNVDPLFRPDNDAAIRARLAHMHASFITTGGEVLSRYTTPAGHKAWYIPNPVDPSIEHIRAFEEASQPYDIFYAVRAATMRGDSSHNDRIRLPRLLRSNIAELRCAYYGFDHAPELFGAAYYQHMSRASMGLNLSHKVTTKGEVRHASDEERFLYASDRLAQYLGSGLLVFTERGFALETQFSEEEMVFFADDDELIEQVRYYLHHPQARQAIARAGWQKAHDMMHATTIAQFMVATICGENTTPYMTWWQR